MWDGHVLGLWLRAKEFVKYTVQEPTKPGKTPCLVPHDTMLFSVLQKL